MKMQLNEWARDKNADIWHYHYDNMLEKNVYESLYEIVYKQPKEIILIADRPEDLVLVGDRIGKNPDVNFVEMVQKITNDKFISIVFNQYDKYKIVCIGTIDKNKRHKLAWIGNGWENDSNKNYYIKKYSNRKNKKQTIQFDTSQNYRR